MCLRPDMYLVDTRRKIYCVKFGEILCHIYLDMEGGVSTVLGPRTSDLFRTISSLPMDFPGRIAGVKLQGRR